jgi:5-hydroxyisourate hydrolase
MLFMIDPKPITVYTFVDRNFPNASKEHSMGLSTHVLDTMHGGPAAGMQVALFTTDGTEEDARATLVRRFTLNADGRSDGPLYDNSTLKAGTYRLVFDVAGYFKARGVTLPEPNFLNHVALDFGVAHTDEHYHVPLLVSPWSYSTYRGS